MTKDGLIGDLVGMRFRDVDRVARWTRDELRSLPPGPVGAQCWSLELLLGSRSVGGPVPGVQLPWRWRIGAVRVVRLRGVIGKSQSQYLPFELSDCKLATDSVSCGPQGKDEGGTVELAIMWTGGLGVWDFVARWGRILVSRMPPTSSFHPSCWTDVNHQPG